MDGRRTAWRPWRRRAGALCRHRAEEQGEVSTEMVQRVASAWTGQPVSGASVEEVTEVDQWTLQTRLGELSPVFKYSWPNGEQVYVSQATGEVVQYTTTASRIGAYLGPIPHWFYFTPLRKHGPQWSRVVIWSSGIGTISAILGVVIGLWMYSPSRKYRYAGAPTSIPYRGQKRWHTVFGLIFGVATVTYAFSGMLSMDPFPSFNDRVQQRQRRCRAEHPARPARRARSGVVRREASAAGTRTTGDAAGEGTGAHVVRGRRRLSGAAGRRRHSRRADAAASRRPDSIRARSSASCRRPPTASMTTRVLHQYDRYYLDRTRRLPLPVVLAEGTSGSADALLHRSEDRAGRPDLQLEQLGQPLAVQRAALAELPVAVQLSPALGHRGDHADARRHGPVCHVPRAGLEGAGTQARASAERERAAATHAVRRSRLAR